MVSILLDNGADANAEMKSGANALTLAAKYGRSEVIKKLLDLGADVNHTKKSGKTALMFASESQRNDDGSYYSRYLYKYGAAALLVKAGADVNAKNNAGTTALMLACKNSQDGYPEDNNLVDLLLRNGADVNAVSSSGATALTLELGSFSDCSYNILSLLLEYGAKIE